jgi:hypothetical protein
LNHHEIVGIKTGGLSGPQSKLKVKATPLLWNEGKLVQLVQ